MREDKAARRVMLGAGRCALVSILAFSMQQAWAKDSRRDLPILSISDASTNAWMSRDIRLRSQQRPVSDDRAQVKHRVARSHAKGAPMVHFEEHFGDCEAGTLPPPTPWDTPPQFVIFDEDGRTPNGNVSLFTDAWNVIADFDDATNCVMASNSWYTPAGASSDWAAFPDTAPITPTAATRLTWRAEAQDPSYRDDYEVRYSTEPTLDPTPDGMGVPNWVAGFKANPPLLTITNEENPWIDRELSLSSLAGTPIFLAFHNISNDEYVLQIDDIVVFDLLENDPALDAIGSSSPLEYSKIPALLAMPVDVSAEVRNAGSFALTDVTVTGDILVDSNSVNAFSTTPIATLASAASQSVPIDSVVLDQLGDWSVEGTVNAIEGDDDPANSSLATVLATATSDEMSRSEGPATGTLGIGVGASGELGHHFDIPGSAVLTAARFSVNNNDTLPDNPDPAPDGDGIGDLNGLDISVNLRAWDDLAGTPGAVIATAFVSIPIDAAIGPLDLEVDLPDTLLPAGRFVLTVAEPTEVNIALQTTPDRFTPGTGWVIFSSNPWANNEFYGFNVTYRLSAVFGAAVTVPVATDDLFTIDEDMPLTDSVAGNDIASSDGGNVWVAGNPANGVLSFDPNGDFSYTPDANFNGADSFSYELCDIDNDCDGATVNITINPVEDVPVAEDDAFIIDEDMPLTDSVAGNDIPSDDGGNVWTATDPANGLLSFSPNGDFSYTPNADFNGADSFTYEICDIDNNCDDATVSLTINPVEDLPVAENDHFFVPIGGSLSDSVASNDLPSSDGGNVWAAVSPLHGELAFNPDGSFIYTLDEGFSGTDGFVYQVCDVDNDCDSATVTLEVLPLDIFANGMEDPS